jgi:acetyl-CoA synthetase
MVRWRPTADVVEESNVYRYMASHGIEDLRGFVRHTYQEPERFWEEFARSIGLRFSKPYERVLDLSRGKPWARWFVRGGFNLGSQIPGSGDIYIRWMSERGDYRELTYSEVLSQARAVASFLRRVMGLSRGDRVAVYMPMIPEIVPIMLGIIRAGLVFVPLFSGFGPEPIRVRIDDCVCRVVFASDTMFRRGREIPMLGNLEGLGVIRVVIDRSGVGKGDYSYYDDVLKTPGDYVEDTEAEDPAMLLYTSGTTGRPKACVHSHIGFSIKAAADMHFHFDAKPGEVVTWITDMGWMMGPWAVLGTLLLRSRLALYEGYPDLGKIVEFVERAGIDILGLSASLVRSFKRERPEPPRISVRIAGNTGEPIDPDSWLWLYRAIGEGPIINYSGGTEISGGILGNYVIGEIKPSAFNSPSPGIDARILGEDCREAPPNTEGELAVLSVWPGMTRGFWRDPQRYINTYWSRCEDIWIHGDLAMYDEEGHYYIVGRSDDTIKVAGKRIGPAEIESTINSHPSIAESACIGIPHEIKGETIYCFAIKKREVTEEELIELVSKQLGRALTPERILFVNDLPRTRNAKIMRRMIRAVMLNKDPGDVSALENPSAIEEIKKLREQIRKP